MIETIQQSFVNPAGLLGLLGLIPLLIFYLVRPKPDEEVMPSMAFFTEEEKEGRVSNALRVLKRNKLLLLHIMFIGLLAVALANPLIEGLEASGESVIVLDSSASMSDNRQQVQNFAQKHLGEQNTIITASDSSDVVARDASPQRARSIIQDYDTGAEGTDLVSALRLASNYNGRIVLASDMDHTTTGRDLDPLMDEISSDREVKVMDLNQENAHAFTGLDVEDGVAEVTIQNFLDENRTLEVVSEEETWEVDVDSLSTTTEEFNLSPGTHELTLPPDELALDNKLYVSIPQERNLRVSYLGEESLYFEQAINSIDFTEYISGYNENADVYFIEESYDIDQRIQDEIQNSDSTVILESRSGVESYGLVENYSGTSEADVRISQGVATSFTSEVDSFDVLGEALAEPSEALVLSEDENVLLYNVEDDKFGDTITYPIFWKNILQRTSNLETGSDLNLESGGIKQFESPVTFRGNELSGEVELDQTGFYRNDNAYAVNLLNSRESSPHVNQISSRNDLETEASSDPSRKYFAALLAVIAALEISYLSRRGEL